MNIDNISNGQILKNYKSLCVELGVPVKTGKAKKLQMLDMERYFSFSRNGHAFIIKEIFDNPIDKIDMRGKSSIYGDMIQFLVADLLVRTSKNHISISRNQLLFTVNMINQNYGFCSQHVKRLSEYTLIEEAVIHDFYNTSNSSFKSAIETALNNLHDKRILSWKKILKLYDGSEHREVNTEEDDLIRQYEREALKSFPVKEDGNYMTVTEIRRTKHWREFKDRVQKELNSNTDIRYYYNAYFISVDQEELKEERSYLLSMILDDSKREEYRDKLNNTVAKNIKVNAQKRHEKSNSLNAKMDKFRINSSYTMNIDSLIDLLIYPTEVDLFSYICKRNEEEFACNLSV
ncbi:hypothetical protein [Priestia aryabhattai]|uniref:hypothetical protein n=1 Tax=Priestia aryabhattai TaxID=412384 RepID=UPI0015F508E3|nr:hypothetical protein [Priestia aryabhattai]